MKLLTLLAALVTVTACGTRVEYEGESTSALAEEAAAAPLRFSCSGSSLAASVTPRADGSHELAVIRTGADGAVETLADLAPVSVHAGPVAWSVDAADAAGRRVLLKIYAPALPEPEILGPGLVTWVYRASLEVRQGSTRLAREGVTTFTCRRR